jgi:hypothetical protein
VGGRHHFKFRNRCPLAEKHQEVALATGQDYDLAQKLHEVSKIRVKKSNENVFKTLMSSSNNLQ